MKQNYSIEEILTAIDELENLKKNKKINEYKIGNKKPSVIPKDTLRLIEEAEKIKY
jgi:hypothetical protein